MSAKWPTWAYTGEPPAWAVEWGEDEHGVFVEFAVGEVVQRLRWVPPGEFMMGSDNQEPSGFSNERPQHPVKLTQGYWMADTPVTQALWVAVMGDNPSAFKGDERRPVEQVSWDDAQAFIAKLNAQPGLQLRLPSEAEWEYACRAGTTTRYWSGDTEADLARVGWYGKNSERTTQPVGQKPANPFGLYDMHGNVWEWCQDYWQRNYEGAATVDPTGPARGERRVDRGGSWVGTARFARSAYRGGLLPVLRNGSRGFRLARGQPGAELRAGRSPAQPGGRNPSAGGAGG